MNKGQLIEAVQKNLGKDTSKAAADAALNAVLNAITKAVKKENVQIIGFGPFSPITCNDKEGIFCPTWIIMSFLLSVYFILRRLSSL